MEAVPVSLSEANVFIDKHHRHHKPLKFHKYSLGVEENGKLVGVCTVNRPVNCKMDDGTRLEVARLCTDGTYNACSFLLARAANVAKNLGYKWMQTYTLEEEALKSHGASLRAAGWYYSHWSIGGTWNNKSRKRIDKHPIGSKVCWVKELDRKWVDRQFREQEKTDD